MTLYILFAGLGSLIYIGVAYAESAFLGYSSPFTAFVSNVLAGLFLFCAYRLLQMDSCVIGLASALGRRIVVTALVFLVGGVAILIAATQEPGHALTCAGQCRTEVDGKVAEAIGALPTESHAAVVGSESARALALGMELFHERGCAGCHRPDGTGVGPALNGLFGSPVQDPACGMASVDESYLREAILTPSATVAMGFPSAMPTFAGQLTEEEVQALVEYLKSLSARP